MSKTFCTTLIVLASGLCDLRAGLDELSRSVIQLSDDIGVFEDVGTNRVQVFWKLPNTNVYLAKPQVVGGSALLVGSRKGQSFIVTARHIATQISRRGEVAFLGRTNESVKMRFGDFVGAGDWIHHPLTDISVHPVNPTPAPQQLAVAGSLWIIPFTYSRTHPRRLVT